MKILECNEISAGYGKRKILDNVSFSLKAGSKVAVLGPNGCGKSTLLKVLTGMLPYQGTVKIGGQEIRAMKRDELSKKTALMGQFHSIAYPYTVYETIMMGRFTHFSKGLFTGPSDIDKKRVMECMKSTGLDGMEETPITELSGGQRQRVFLARALVQEAPLILLDEPTSHLDLKHQVELIDYLKERRNQAGQTVVGVLHDLSLAIRFADYFLLMKDGKVEAFGKAAEVLRAEILQKVFGMDVVAYLKEGMLMLPQSRNGLINIDNA